MLRNGVLHFGNVPRHEFPWELQRFIEVIPCTVFIYIFNCYYFLHFSQGQDCTLSIFLAIIFLKGGIHMHFEIRCGETKFSSNSWSRLIFKNHLRLFRGVMKTKLSKIRQDSGKKNKRISLYQLNTPKRVDNEGSHIALGCLKGASWFYVQLSSVSYKEHAIAVAKIGGYRLDTWKTLSERIFLAASSMTWRKGLIIVCQLSHFLLCISSCYLCLQVFAARNKPGFWQTQFF